MRTVCATIFLLVALVSPVAVASAAAQSAASVSPTLIPISGALQTSAGEPRTGSVLLVLSLYDGKDDPSPRWIEHQVVTLDASGRYEVQFGSTREEGLPPELFSGTTAAQWVGVAIENEAEQPRMMLVSVPYAAKATSADTLAGRAASDFVLTANLTDQVKAVLQERRSGEGDGPVTNAVTLNFLQKGDGGMGTTTDSNVFEVGGNVGIGTTAPDVRLAVIDTNASESRIELANAAGYLSSKKIFLALRPTNNYGQLQAYNYGSGGMNLAINPSGGNVGIGTSAPDVKLSVVDTNTNESRIELGSAPGYASSKKIFLGLRPSANYGVLQAYSYGGGGGMNIIINPSGGDVGIGTLTPTAKLHVAGHATVTGNLTVDGNIAAKYQDVAEWVDSVEPLEAGTVVIIDETGHNRVMAAASQYDSRVAGAVSPQPGLTLGEPGEGRVLVAQSGRVRIKADARYGAIKAGDLLVSSPRKGYAMRSKPVRVGGASMHRPGTVLGKALEPLASGASEILVLLTLQ